MLRLAAFVLGAMLATGVAAPATAQIGSDRYAAIVLDHRTGRTLVAANPDEIRHPASLTKMMTLYMLFEAMRDGRMMLQSRITMSEEAASRPPSKLGIPAGLSITAEQAILALVTRSANDVAAAVGEALGGSEQRFGQLMTQRARSLGMTSTTFRNASGLPDRDQVTTARDMATLGSRLINDFPQHYHYFSVTHARFGAVQIRNHNRMLTEHEGVDGIKTGYIRDSGFNIVTSAERGGRRVVGAVFGGASWVERDAHMAALLDQSFEALGVAPRAVAGGSGLMREAQAAALPAAAAAAAAIRRPPATRNAASTSRTTPARTAPRRAAASAAPSRAAPSRATPRAATRAPQTRPATTRPATTRPAAPRAAPAPARVVTPTPQRRTVTTRVPPRTVSSTANSALIQPALAPPQRR